MAMAHWIFGTALRVAQPPIGLPCLSCLATSPPLVCNSRTLPNCKHCPHGPARSCSRARSSRAVPSPSPVRFVWQSLTRCDNHPSRQPSQLLLSPFPGRSSAMAPRLAPSAPPTSTYPTQLSKAHPASRPPRTALVPPPHNPTHLQVQLLRAHVGRPGRPPRQRQAVRVARLRLGALLLAARLRQRVHHAGADDDALPALRREIAVRQVGLEGGKGGGGGWWLWRGRCDTIAVGRRGP